MAQVLELKREHEVSEDKDKIVINTTFKEEFTREELKQIANKRSMDLANIKSQLTSMKMQLEKIDKEVEASGISEMENIELLKKKIELIDKLKMKESLREQIQKLERDVLVAEKDSVEFSRIANLCVKESESSSEGK